MKTKSLWLAASLGLGLAAALLALTRPIPAAQAGGMANRYYVREGAAGDCLSVTTPCGIVQQAIARAEDAAEVWVTTGTYTENLVITRGITLRGGWDVSFTAQSPVTYPTIVDGSGAYVVSATTSAYPIAISGVILRNGNDGIHLYGGGGSSGSTDLIVVDSLIYSMTSQAIEIEAGAVSIEGNVISGTGGEGIKINGGVADVRSNTVYATGQAGIRTLAGSNATIVGNTVNDVHGSGQHGIRVQASATVAGNQVYSVTGRGIDARGGAVTVTSNLVYNTGDDGIRTDNTSTAVTLGGNTVYSAGNDGIDARGGTVVVAGNVVSGCTDNGIKSETIGVWVDIERNRVFGNAASGIAIRQAPVFTLANNMVSSNISASVELSGTGSGFVYHNTLVGGETGTQGNGIAVLSPLATTLANNIVVSHNVGISATMGAALVVSNTLLWGNGSDPILGASVITEAPAFVAPAQRDYHILPDSPAVNAGVPIGVLTDIDGESRLGAPDVGADEVARKVYLPLVMR